jgi:hypothetical protein
MKELGKYRKGNSGLLKEKNERVALLERILKK